MDATTPHDASTPVPKPRTLLHKIIPPDSSTPSTDHNSQSSLTRSRSTSFSEKVVTPQTPPTPRPRSGEHKRLKAQWEVEKQTLQQKLTEAESQASQWKLELDQARDKIDELEISNMELQDTPAVDVEASLREKDIALQVALEESLKLRRCVREQESALREKQSLLQRRNSRIEGLEEEVRTIKQPLLGDLKKRTEIRLSETMGQLKQKEVLLNTLRKVKF